VEFRIRAAGFDREIAAEAAGGDPQKHVPIVRIGPHGTYVGRLQGGLEFAEFEHAGQALSRFHISVQTNVDFAGF
jgi:hypothetical protein